MSNRKKVEAWAIVGCPSSPPMVSLDKQKYNVCGCKGCVKIRLVPATSEAEVRRLKRIERAAKKYLRNVYGLREALDYSEAGPLAEAILSRSLRTKRTKP